MGLTTKSGPLDKHGRLFWQRRYFYLGPQGLTYTRRAPPTDERPRVVPLLGASIEATEAEHGANTFRVCPMAASSSGNGGRNSTSAAKNHSADGGGGGLEHESAVVLRAGSKEEMVAWLGCLRSWSEWLSLGSDPAALSVDGGIGIDGAAGGVSSASDMPDGKELDAMYEAMLDALAVPEASRGNLREMPPQHKWHMLREHEAARSTTTRGGVHEDPASYVSLLRGGSSGNASGGNASGGNASGTAAVAPMGPGKLCALRVSLFTADLEWVRSFIALGGVPLLANRLSQALAHGDNGAAYECARGIKAVADVPEGVAELSRSGSDAARAVALAMTANVRALRATCLRILAQVAMHGDAGHRASLTALDAYHRNGGTREKARFQDVVRWLLDPASTDGLRLAAVALVNALVNTCDDLRERLALRREFVRLGIGEAFDQLRADPVLGAQVDLFETEHALDVGELPEPPGGGLPDPESLYRYDLGDLSRSLAAVRAAVTGTPDYDDALAVAEWLRTGVDWPAVKDALLSGGHYTGGFGIGNGGGSGAGGPGEGAGGASTPSSSSAAATAAAAAEMQTRLRQAEATQRDLETRLDAKSRQVRMQIELADRHAQIIHALEKAVEALRGDGSTNKDKDKDKDNTKRVDTLLEKVGSLKASLPATGVAYEPGSAESRARADSVDKALREVAGKDAAPAPQPSAARLPSVIERDVLVAPTPASPSKAPVPPPPMPGGGGGGGPPPPPPPMPGSGGPPPPPPPMPGGKSGGGGPPPPPPPPGGGPKSGAVATRPSVKPRVPMKHVNWSKIPNGKLPSTLWAKADDAEVTVDKDELESLFAAARSDSQAGGGGGGGGKNDPGDGSGPKAPRSTKVILLDHKRANNVAILVSRLGAKPEALSKMIANCEDAGLSENALSALRTCVPTDDELIMLQSYEGDTAGLGVAEQCMLALGVVPRCSQVVDALNFRRTFPASLTDAETQLASVLEACKIAKESKKYPRFAYLVLAIGNYLNGGTFRGGAGGFRTDSLCKLADTRSHDRKKNLMDYAVQLAKKQRPDCLEFTKEFEGISDGAKVSIPAVRESIAELKAGVEAIGAELRLAAERGEDRSPFVLTFTPFHESALEKVGRVTGAMERVGRAFEELCTWLGEDKTTGTQAVLGGLMQVRSAVAASVEKEEKRIAALERAKGRKPRETGGKYQKGSSAQQESSSVPRRGRNAVVAEPTDGRGNEIDSVFKKLSEGACVRREEMATRAQKESPADHGSDVESYYSYEYESGDEDQKETYPEPFADRVPKVQAHQQQIQPPPRQTQPQQKQQQQQQQQQAKGDDEASYESYEGYESDTEMI